MATAPILPTPAPSVVPESAPLSEGARIVDTFVAPSKAGPVRRHRYFASWEGL